MVARRGRAPADLTKARKSVQGRIRAASSLFVAVDYDGTLVPIVARPEMARPSDETLEVIDSLSKTPGVRVAVVSGRSLEVLRKFLPLPNVILSGLHGLEIWPQVERAATRTDVHAVRADLENLLLLLEEKIGSGKPPRIEDKRHALAFHFRGEKPGIVTRQRTAIRAAFEEMGEAPTVMLVPGKQVLEARAVNVDKGASTRAVWKQLSPGSLPIAIGDDVTDEDLFEAFAKEGITVRVGKSARKTGARYYLRNPVELVAWLRDLGALWREAGAGGTKEG